MLFMANLAGWQREEIQVYISHLRREFRDPAIHGYYNQTIVWARKPGTP